MVKQMGSWIHGSLWAVGFLVRGVGRMFFVDWKAVLERPWGEAKALGKSLVCRGLCAEWERGD